MILEQYGFSLTNNLQHDITTLTLKSNATLIDKILFVSDKISFDLPGEHTYLSDMRKKVDEGYIDEAILIYLNTIWEQRDKMKLIHPWLIEAREQLLIQA